nr:MULTISPECIES: iron-containing alcohol dehydrogenase [unclassified Paenibacillus]
MLETPNTTDVIIAVGAGTIHDIVRFTGYKMNKPFISVPTAPSVDGFTSIGAPIIIQGEKKTISASAPDAIFADLDILTGAPQSLLAAGFCDMLGKYTSLFDWKFTHWVAGEPHCPAAERITKRALMDCVNHVQEIAQREEGGIRVLTKALIESGLAVLIFGSLYGPWTVRLLQPSWE